MPRLLRRVARALLGVKRPAVYYLPWLVQPGLECVLLLSNLEARFKSGYNAGPFPVRVTQYGADGRRQGRYRATLEKSTDVVELPLSSAASSWGFVTVEGERVHSDLYVTLSDGGAYAATHGRQEFVETYPIRAQMVLAVLGRALGWLGRTLPAFVRYQYVYVGAEGRADLLVLNLANVTNRVRVVPLRDADDGAARLIRIPPMGSHLLDVSSLVPPPARGTRVVPLRLEGNAWFNLYLVGAVHGDRAAPLSLMHVK